MSLPVDIIISKAEKNIKKNKFLEAEKLYSSVLDIFPNNIRAQNGINKIKQLNFNSKKQLQNLPDNVYNELLELLTKKSFGVILKKIQTIETIYINSFELFNFKGIALYQLGNIDEAITCFSKSIDLNSNFHEAYNNIGNCYQNKNELQNAIKSFQRSIEIYPNSFQVFFNLGNCYKKLSQFYLAEENYKRSIELKPSNIDAYYNLGNMYAIQKEHMKSIWCFDSILKIDAGHNMSLSHKIHQQLHICEWSIENKKKLVENINLHNKPAMPFETLSIIDDPLLQKKTTELYVKQKYSSLRLNNIPYKNRKKNLIRIGYFSSDFYNHATMHLMQNIFECHDQNNFQVFLYDYGTNKPDEMTEKIKKQALIYKKIDHLSNTDIFNIVRQDQIEIAVDLKGYTGGGKPDLFYQRIAPIQVSYLGYPGTVGFGQMDYILADSILIPEEQKSYYFEKVVHLPNSYQVNNNDRFIPEKKFYNSNLGLPNDSFVFCNFNNNYKINIEVLDIWVRLLHDVDNSVLWLLESNSNAKNRLEDYLESKGISKNRIIFAPKTNINDHLSRHLNADLFLDTFTYNAHTTGSDALWCGIPIVTKLGSSFASRVCASLLNGVNLTKLITKTSEEYFQLAYFFSQNRSELKKIKDHLINNRKKHPLFNSRLFCKNLENSYKFMINNYNHKIF